MSTALSKSQLTARFRELAAHTEGIDVEVYARFGKDPFEPVLGLGPDDSRVGFFGRDPGRDEVQHGEPFIGAGGQLVRRALYRALHDGKALPDFDSSREIGRDFYWANTVPYKPVGNKAWSTKIKQRFQPTMARLLIQHWQGEHIITLGREAFLWFGLLQSREARDKLDAFWLSENRFSESLRISLQAGDDDNIRREFTLHPLPHPSPLNATWYGRFPGLLDARLQQLNVKPGKLRI
ncbi:uracil-DNA glycosylase family protein [Hydrocarboniphaga sp.]|uniref:uracil-DNA glycosylase family protein n=1 Tax=Hydrocarboniphaga sp. TaxID=2033016 RepID=UPI003D0F9317